MYKFMDRRVGMLLLLSRAGSKGAEREIWASQGRQEEKFSQVGTAGNLGW
jgi:hypothetical protein